jgi:hypothetical protein
MSATISATLMTQARRWLAATGLLPFARRADRRLYVGLRCAFRRDFRVVICPASP